MGLIEVACRNCGKHFEREVKWARAEWNYCNRQCSDRDKDEEWNS